MKIHIFTVDTTDLALEDIAATVQAAVDKHLNTLDDVIDFHVTGLNTYTPHLSNDCEETGFLLTFKTRK